MNARCLMNALQFPIGALDFINYHLRFAVRCALIAETSIVVIYNPIGSSLHHNLITACVPCIF